MSAVSRRGLLASGLAFAAGGLWPRGAAAIDPIPRKGPFHGRLSLAAYGLRDQLQGKKEPKLTLLEAVDKAADWGFDAFEATAYYFPETTPDYLAKLKRHAALLGLDISGGAIGNNFCVPDAAKLRKEIEQTKAWIERYSLLGAKTIRIFAGPLAKGDQEEEARKRCIASIQDCCDHAGKHGVLLALENHGGIVATPEQLLSIVKEIKHDWFGVNLDTGNFRTEDPYGDVEKLAPYAVTVQVKVEIQKKGQKKEFADLSRLVAILRKANYRGYVVLEYEAAEDPMAAIPRYASEMRELLK